jgi:hypothetical protein
MYILYVVSDQNIQTVTICGRANIKVFDDHTIMYGEKVPSKGAVSFQLKNVICDLWENGKSYDLAKLLKTIGFKTPRIQINNHMIC